MSVIGRSHIMLQKISPELVLSLFLFVLCVHGKKEPLVSTALGEVSGIHELSYRGRTFSAFYGIPYAQPPIGPLRFKEPQPLNPWSGVWKANTSYQCAQIEHAPVPEGGVLLGDEDCLYLNVFVPRKNPVKGVGLDVVVHIHGGAFMFGSSVGYAGPKFLMDRDVVLVTINYRVGILGFLSTEDDAIPGNLGMKDQVAALKWIKDNIKQFGGNPDSVTLTGLSAGGASVHYHYLSPLSRGLFSRGISISGTALAPWTIQEAPLEKARLIGSYVGCEQEDTKQLAKCLRERSARQIVEVTRLLRPWLFNPFSPLGLVVEKTGSEPFLPEHPYLLLSKGKIYDVPWLTSLTSEEGLYPAADFALADHYLKDLDNRWTELAPHLLDYNYTIPEREQVRVSFRLREEYFNRKPISRETYKELIDLMSDRLFAISSEEAAKLHSHVAKSPVYFYYFSFMGDKLESLSVHFSGVDQNDGVCHGDDVMYLFSNPHNPDSRLTEIDEQMQDILLNMWMTYIKSEKPSVLDVEWTPVTKDLKEPIRQLRIHAPTKIFMQRSDEINRHRDFWQAISLQENKNLIADFKRDEL